MLYGKRKYVFIILIITIFPFKCFAFEDGDFQYWNTESVSFKIKDDWKFKIEEEFRFGDNVKRFYYQHSDFGITYSGLAKWLDVGVNYRLIFEEKSDKWNTEHRPHFHVTLKHNVEGFSFSDRSRFEYRIKQNSDDSWRYRNKFTIKLPKFTDFQIRPYVADEIFIDFDHGEFNRNRAYAGIAFKIVKHLSADIFYLLQTSKKDNHWKNYHIIGSKLKLAF